MGIEQTATAELRRAGVTDTDRVVSRLREYTRLYLDGIGIEQVRRSRKLPRSAGSYCRALYGQDCRPSHLVILSELLGWSLPQLVEWAQKQEATHNGKGTEKG